MSKIEDQTNQDTNQAPVYGYTGWALPDHERHALLAIIPPVYPDVIAHHVTDCFGVSSDHPLPAGTRADVIAIADDGKVQALVVSIDGSTRRPDGGTYHITWSHDRAAGTRPVDANKAVQSHLETLAWPIPITMVPSFFATVQQPSKKASGAGQP